MTPADVISVKEMLKPTQRRVPNLVKLFREENETRREKGSHTVLSAVLQCLLNISKHSGWLTL